MPTIVQTFQGRVTGLWGTATMRGSDGRMHVLKLGDMVHKGDVILTSQDGIVQLSPDETAAVTATAAMRPASASPDIDRVISGLNEPNPADATAAGVTGGDGAGDLTPGLRVQRIAESLTPAALTPAGDEGNARFDPRDGGATTREQEAPRPLITADSNTINATEEGPAVSLGLTAPTGVTSAAVITITQLPLIGTLLKADGTPVTVGSVLTTAELTGLQYLPPADYNGTAPIGAFGYTVGDHGVTVGGGVVIELAPINDAPVGNADTATTLEDTPITGNVLTNDRDVDGDTLTVTQYTIAGVSHAAGSSTAILGVGTIVINANGSYTFTPATDYNGPVPPIGYTIGDGTVTTTSTLTLTVTPVNDAPDAIDDVASTPINVPVTIAVLANDRDKDGDAINVTGATLADATKGTLVINPDSTVTFTPANNHVGPVVITYTVSDGHGGTDTATVTVNVGNNAPPTGADSARTIAEDTIYTVRTGDFGFADADAGQTLASVRIDALPAAGSLLLAGIAVAAGAVISAADIAAGKLVFMPAPDANGAPYANITFSVQDSAGAFDTAPNTLTLNVTPVNDVPVAVADTLAVVEDTPLVGSVAGNDTLSGDGGNIFALVAGNGPAHGGIVFSADGTFTYTPSANYNGPDTFTYSLTDADGDVSTAKVTINVAPVNDAPTTLADINTTPEDTPLIVDAAHGVLANDSDVDSATLTVTQFSVAGVAGSFAAGAAATVAGVGSLTINADGSYGFTPTPDYNGPVPVATYTVSDGALTSSSTLTLVVTAVNDAPTLSLDANQSHNTLAVQAIVGLFNTGESNAGAALPQGTIDSHYIVVSAPAGSTLTASATGLPGAWVANDADSTWIGSTGNQPTGVYQYQTSFTLQPGADPASVNISFDLSSDNNLRDILVNGVSTGFSSNLQYSQFTHVDLHGVSDAFTIGLNTITFVVDNRDPGSPTASGPTGLRIDNMSGNVAVIVPDGANHIGDFAKIYVEGTPVSIADTDIAVRDIDSPTMQSATITLTNAQPGDVLQFGALPPGIVASVNAAGNIVTLTGAASQANYEAAIRAVQFDNTGDTPPAAIDRVVTVVVNDGFLNSNTVTTTIHVVPVADAPTLDLDGNNSTAPGTGYAATYVENAAAIRIVDADVTIQDVDSANLRSATAHIVNVQAGDVLTVAGLPAGISAAVYDPVSGILTLSGNATLAAYQAALRAIGFSNASNSPSAVTRDIEISVNDGEANSNVAVSHISVVAVNDAPSGADKTITTLEDTAYVLGRADFGFADPLDVPANSFASVTIDPTTAGALTLNGVAIVAGTVVTVAQLDAGLLKFTPASDANGNAYATLRFQVRDDGGTVNGGVDTDPSPNTVTFNVTPVNDPAVIGGTQTGATVEDLTLTATGTLTIADPDAGQAAFIVQSNVAGAHGSFGVDAAGQWTYALNNADPAVQALAQGQALPNEVFTVNSIDGTAATVTVTITGTNDAPIAFDDVVITNVAAGQNIAMASGALTRNDTDIDNNTALAVSNSFNAVNGTVSGTSPVIFKDITSFGTNAQVQAEAPLFPGDSETNPLNNSIATAYEVERGRFGQVDAADAPYVTDPTLASFKWTGRIDDTTGTPNATDQDFIKVYLHAGEKIILDIDGADSGRTDIGTDPNAVDTLLQFYSASGALLADNDDALPTEGGLGSVKSGYHNNSLDSYLEYTVAADGYYYVNVTAFNNNANGIVQDDGNYQLWMSIKSNGASYPASFDYTTSDGIATDEGHAVVTTVQGSVVNGTAASEILIGGSGDDTVNGGGGNDWIQGGAGSDRLTGGSGSDVFAWVLADRGPAGTPPTDTITNFSVVAPSAGGDVLDLRDLLQGESKAGTGPGNLQNYLDFDTTSAPGSTIVHISSGGGFAGGVYSASAEDQRIVLQGVDVRSPGAFGLPSSATDNDVIQQLLQRGKLVTDGP